MLLSILLKVYGFVLFGVAPYVAAACWLLSLVADAVYLSRSTEGERTRCLADARELLLLNAGCLLSWILARALILRIAMRWKDGLELPARIVASLMRCLQLRAAAMGGEVHLTTMAGPLQFPVDFDRLALLPPLLTGCFVMVYVLRSSSRWSGVLRAMTWTTATLLLATLLRWVFVTGFILFLCDFVGYETDELPISPLLKPGLSDLLHLPFLLVAASILQPRIDRISSIVPAKLPKGASALRWPWLAVVILLALVVYEPDGREKSGKILINTYHTRWSRTDRPYDKAWYGPASGYNYACLKRFFGEFHEVEELRERITPEHLADASVLMIYDPDVAFTPKEKQAILAFVARGGGLFLVGDHTNVFGSTSHLNPLCRPMGFIFRDDVMFDLDTDFFQLYDLPLFPSPLLQGIPFFKFRGPASIRATSCSARTTFRLGNAKSLRAIYSVNNFYPPPHDNPKMRVGDFAAGITTHYGRGRVVAFADSTIFSNFEMFYPGKYEYLLNVVNWLNRADGPLTGPVKRTASVCLLLGLGLLLYKAKRPRGVLRVGMVLVLITATVLTVSNSVERRRAGFSPPVHPMSCLYFVVDPSNEAYTLRHFTTKTPYDQKFDVFIQWVLRNDLYSGFFLPGPEYGNDLYHTLKSSDRVDMGLCLIVNHPDQLRLLVESGPELFSRTEHLLLMFSRSMLWEDVAKALDQAKVLPEPGMISKIAASWPEGEMRFEDGSRRIAVVFPAERYSDRHMGFSEKVTPNETQLKLYHEQFALLDWLFDRSPKEKKRSLPPSEDTLESSTRME